MGQGVGTDEVPAEDTKAGPGMASQVGSHTRSVPGDSRPPSPMPDAGMASTWYSHNVVGFQSCVWRGVDEYIGKGVLVMIVHLI